MVAHRDRGSAITRHNTFIDKREIALLKGEIEGIMGFDSYLRERLSDGSIEGLKGWEYGKLVDFIRDFEGLKVLDVGPGDSTFSLFLAGKGAHVVTIDYPQPMAPGIQSYRRRCLDNGVGVHFSVRVYVSGALAIESGTPTLSRQVGGQYHDCLLQEGVNLFYEQDL